MKKVTKPILKRILAVALCMSLCMSLMTAVAMASEGNKEIPPATINLLLSGGQEDESEQKHQNPDDQNDKQIPDNLPDEQNPDAQLPHGDQSSKTTKLTVAASSPLESSPPESSPPESSLLVNSLLASSPLKSSPLAQRSLAKKLSIMARRRNPQLKSRILMLELMAALFSKTMTDSS